jgi:hypothetical protein
LVCPRAATARRTLGDAVYSISRTIVILVGN